MKVAPATLAGLFTLELERNVDDRGWFVRVFDEEVLAAAGLVTAFPQHSEARNAHRHLIRGLHFQAEPHAETKIIRCTRGAVYDVLVDVRPGSPTYGSWQAFELSEDRPRALYVPGGFAHGYQTLTAISDLQYHISERYVAAAARGFAYNSPELAIPWPAPAVHLSERDRTLPPFVR